MAAGAIPVAGTLLVGGPLALGFALFILSVSRGQEAEIGATLQGVRTFCRGACGDVADDASHRIGYASLNRSGYHIGYWLLDDLFYTGRQPEPHRGRSDEEEQGADVRIQVEIFLPQPALYRMVSTRYNNVGYRFTVGVSLSVRELRQILRRFVDQQKCGVIGGRINRGYNQLCNIQ